MDAHDPKLDDLIAQALGASDARIMEITHQGKRIWLKRRERLNLLRRVQKGRADKGFETERDALHLLYAKGAPVPPILAEGPDYFALPDCGTSLNIFLHRRVGDSAFRCAVFAKAAQALAQLHKNHVSHGRPSIKDICWDDGRITFLDFERYAPHRNTPAGHAEDVLVFLFSAFAVSGKPMPEIDAAIAAYRAADPGGIWELVQRRARRLRWMNWITKPIQWRGPGKAREFKAIPILLAALRASEPAQ